MHYKGAFVSGYNTPDEGAFGRVLELEKVTFGCGYNLIKRAFEKARDSGVWLVSQPQIRVVLVLICHHSHTFKVSGCDYWFAFELCTGGAFG